MITLKIFDRKVKIRPFTEMLTGEYLTIGDNLSVVEYIALQIGKDPLDLMAVEMAPQVVHRVNNIDINGLRLKSLKYKKKLYTDFNVMVYGVHYFSDLVFRQKRDNPNLWVFAIILSFKVSGDFDMNKIAVVYKDLLKMKAVDVVPVMNLFISTYYKKKVFTIKNLLLFIKMSPKIAKTLILQSWSFIIRKVRYRKSRKFWEKNS